ncbi:MAG: iron-regulated protein [Candidatus Latescibacteria bacterium]|mgnify:FL=1|jgi:prolyl 4-hydroxylase|nr:iron-regulated protein [Candidatus Latescibacterota bacterium]
MTVTQLDGQNIFTLDNFLSIDECDSFIKRSEQIGYETATLSDGRVYEDTRNNDRVIIDDKPLAHDLFLRAKPYLPEQMEGESITGFNERFRIYRYQDGQRFKPHGDGSYLNPETLEESKLTFMIYLNESMVGGSTNFYSSISEALSNQPNLEVKPVTGLALVFVHPLWHEGASVEDGRKYVLRTDVMYNTKSL